MRPLLALGRVSHGKTNSVAGRKQNRLTPDPTWRLFEKRKLSVFAWIKLRLSDRLACNSSHYIASFTRLWLQDCNTRCRSTNFAFL